MRETETSAVASAVGNGNRITGQRGKHSLEDDI